MMPTTLTTPASFTVTDSAGRTLRHEPVDIGTDVMQWLRDARNSYQAQGWDCEALRPPHWNFSAEKGDRHIVIAVRKLPSEQNKRSAANHCRNARWPSLTTHPQTTQ